MLALLFMVPPALSAAPAPGAFPWRVESTTLENGCQVAVVPMPTPGIVATAVWMRVGSRNETEAGRTGFAHFFEHLVFYGSEAMDSEAREARLLELGVGDNAWTWLDETVYHATVDTRSLDDFLGMQADMLANLHLTADDVRKEAGAVYGEYRKTQSDPAFHLEQAARRAAFPTHTYGHDTLGFEADIAAMPDAHAHALGFYERWYRPENAIVVLAGDIEPAAGRALVERHFGAWRREAPAEPLAVAPEAAQDAPHTAEVSWPTPTPPHLFLAWRIPAFHPSDPTSAALHVVDALLLGSTARLRNRLVREDAVAFDVSGGAEETVDPGLFTLHVELRDGVDPARVEAIVDEELARLASGVDAQVLTATRDHVRYAALTRLDEPAAVASTVGSRLRRGADPADLGAFDRAVAGVDAAAVAKAVRELLVPANRTTVTLQSAGEGAHAE